MEKGVEIWEEAEVSIEEGSEIPKEVEVSVEEGAGIPKEVEVSVEVGAEIDDMASTYFNRDVNCLSNIGNDERRKTDTPPFATAAFAISQSM